MPAREVVFLTVHQVVVLHRIGLDEHGGQDGIRDAAGLASAVGQPEASYGGQYLHAGLAEMAAAYAFHIAQSQAFLDGNKRAAVLSALQFLELNDVYVNSGADSDIFAALDERWSKPQLTALFRAIAPGV